MKSLTKVALVAIVALVMGLCFSTTAQAQISIMNGGGTVGVATTVTYGPYPYTTQGYGFYIDNVQISGSGGLAGGTFTLSGSASAPFFNNATVSIACSGTYTINPDGSVIVKGTGSLLLNYFAKQYVMGSVTISGSGHLNDGGQLTLSITGKLISVPVPYTNYFNFVSTDNSVSLLNFNVLIAAPM